MITYRRRFCKWGIHIKSEARWWSGDARHSNAEGAGNIAVWLIDA